MDSMSARHHSQDKDRFLTFYSFMDTLGTKSTRLKQMNHTDIFKNDFLTQIIIH